MAQHKVRADELVFLQGLAESREQAKRLIMAGKVTLTNNSTTIPLRLEKPGHKYPLESICSLIGIERFVSRGAYKLLTALDFFKIDVKNCICLDAGASTGGFTDCLLQHGASKVYAIDVGKGQLHEKLCTSEQVINIEGVNLRTASKDLITEEVDILTIDVSFISLTLVLPSCIHWLKTSGTIIALIKPQFELYPDKIKKGVVKETSLQYEAVEKIIHFCQSELGLIFIGVVPSAIKGPKGNQEYLIYLKKR